MSKKKRTSLESIFGGASKEDRPPAPYAAPASAAVATPVPASPPVARIDSSRRRTFEEQHKKQSVYLEGPVYEQLRRLAFEERRKMHDYLIEGLDSVFRSRGLPGIAELEKEDA